METLTVDSRKPFSLELIRQAISGVCPVEMGDAGTLVVRGIGSGAYIHLHETKTEYGRQQLVIDYSDVSLAKSIIERIAGDPGVMVDNDFGTVLPGDQFVARVRADGEWNWRRSAKSYSNPSFRRLIPDADRRAIAWKGVKGRSKLLTQIGLGRFR